MPYLDVNSMFFIKAKYMRAYNYNVLEDKFVKIQVRSGCWLFAAGPADGVTDGHPGGVQHLAVVGRDVLHREDCE